MTLLQMPLNTALPIPHFLESWGDVMTTGGNLRIGISLQFNHYLYTAQFQEILLKWSGNTASYHDYLKGYWSSNILEGTSWNQALHDGFFTKEFSKKVSKNSINISSVASALVSATKASAFELTYFLLQL